MHDKNPVFSLCAYSPCRSKTCQHLLKRVYCGNKRREAILSAAPLEQHVAPRESSGEGFEEQNGRNFLFPTLCVSDSIRMWFRNPATTKYLRSCENLRDACWKPPKTERCHRIGEYPILAFVVPCSFWLSSIIVFFKTAATSEIPLYDLRRFNYADFSVWVAYVDQFVRARVTCMFTCLCCRGKNRLV